MRKSSAFWVVMLAGIALGCGDSSSPPDSDAEVVDGLTQCSDNGDCSDGRFCNGDEVCDPDDSAADAMGCVSGASPCSDSECDEEGDECTTDCEVPDGDGDGHNAESCGGDDCDDEDADRFPGNTEVCDTENHDEDCDDSTFGDVDMDEDGRVDAACCNGEACGLDCDDSDSAVFGGATETCNAVDDDCDGDVDEELSFGSYYPDCDGDGSGAQGASPMMGCAPPDAAPPCSMGSSSAGWALSSGDCDDERSEIGPGVTELCNGIDDNCNGSTDEDVVPTCYQDLDGDLHGNPMETVPSCTCPAGYVLEAGDCDDRPGVGFNIHADATELCDGLDNNCNGSLDFPGEDDDGDGFPDATVCTGLTANTDCNDSDAAVNPSASEIIANNQDDDCDGEELCYVDDDGDGFGTSTTVSTTDIACTPAQNHAPQDGDCCDQDARAHPGQDQYFESPRTSCGGYDFNCASGEELEPLPHGPSLTSGSCNFGSTCTGSTLVPGWVDAAPAACGQSAPYNEGCNVRQVCTPMCVSLCRVTTSTFTRGCR